MKLWAGRTQELVSINEELGHSQLMRLPFYSRSVHKVKKLDYSIRGWLMRFRSAFFEADQQQAKAIILMKLRTMVAINGNTYSV